MPTRRKFRRNNLKSSRRNKRGGDGDPPWFKGSEKSYEEILASPSPDINMDPDKVAEYYLNKAKTQLYKKGNLNNITIKTPYMSSKERAKKAAKTTYGKNMTNLDLDQDTLDDIGKYIWHSNEFELIRIRSGWKKNSKEFKQGLDGVAGLRNCAILLELCYYILNRGMTTGQYEKIKSYLIRFKKQTVGEKDKAEAEIENRDIMSNVLDYIENIKELNDFALFFNGRWNRGITLNLLEARSGHSTGHMHNAGNWKDTGWAYNPLAYPGGRFSVSDNDLIAMGELYKKIIKLFVVKFNNNRKVVSDTVVKDDSNCSALGMNCLNGGRKIRRRKRKRTRRKRRKKGKKSRRRKKR